MGESSRNSDRTGKPGNVFGRIARWRRQLRIFLYPFYCAEYAIAQLGALQVWRNSLHDQSGAVARYREALALGGTRPPLRSWSTTPGPASLSMPRPPLSWSA